MKKTKDGYCSDLNIKKIYSLIQDSLNSFEQTQLATLLVKDGRFNQQTLDALFKAGEEGKS